MKPVYKVINASAGSGKTYTLVKNLLALCLQHPAQPDSIARILALTFTNKAANEMKHRIISWLKEFTKTEYAQNEDLKNIQAELKQRNVRLTLEDLHDRSQQLLDYALHHYSTLNIGTIDKFNAKLVRSFSQELGLAQNFALEIDPNPLLLEAVDKMLDNVGDESELSGAFLDFVHYSLDNDERVHIKSTLYKSAKEFVQDKHYFELQQTGDFDWKGYEKSKEALRQQIRSLQQEAEQRARQMLELMESRGVETPDFSGGESGLGGFFKKFLANKAPALPESLEKEESLLAKYAKGASAKGKKKEAEIMEMLDEMLEAREFIIRNYTESQKKQRILNALLPLKVNKEVQDQLAILEEENDLVLLPKFNIMIHENLRNEPTAFIYEKIGTQFSHYFFDEFQDTSTLQWQNFVPLRDHANSMEHMSFTVVGDPKQSIYRFRGGDAQLMLNIISGNDGAALRAETENLESNYRSAQNIVDFNNELYEYMSGSLHGEYRDLFGTQAKQISKTKWPGRVRVTLVEKFSAGSEFFAETAEKMREDIAQCLELGYRFSDITILCRDNGDIKQFSQLLGRLQVNYKGMETYVRTISESGLTLNLSVTLLALTEFLQWQDDPKEFQHCIKMMYHLQQLGRIKMNDFTAEALDILAQENKEDMQRFIEERYQVKLSAGNLIELNLYNLTEHYLQEFAVDDHETDFILAYLEMVYDYTQNNAATLKDFLRYWTEEGQHITIQATENVDAIQLMTIHKSKGLEFPVVLLPLRNKKPRAGSYWFNSEDTAGPAKVNVKLFDDKLTLQDPKIAAFNSHYDYQDKIDRFCLQYVATTRASEQLFFYVERPPKSANYLEIYDFLAAKIADEDTGKTVSFELYEVPPEQLRKQPEKERQAYQTQSIRFRNPDKLYPEAIKIATPSKSYQNRIEKVRLGIFAHEILARICTPADVQPVLESYLLEGTITLQEKERIEDRLYKVISEYEPYFQPGLEVRNEQEIMLATAQGIEMFRPDRLIKKEEGFIIIDFKTGEVSPKHQAQLSRYQHVLEKLGHTVLETVIIYV